MNDRSANDAKREGARGNGTAPGRFGHQSHSTPAPFTGADQLWARNPAPEAPDPRPIVIPDNCPKCSRALTEDERQPPEHAEDFPDYLCEACTMEQMYRWCGDAAKPGMSLCGPCIEETI